MALNDVLHDLQHHPRFSRRITAWQHMPAVAARYAPFPAGLDPRLIQVLHRRGITQLYCHQAEATAAALAGQHVVIATPTASGKTLCYHLPVLQALLDDERARGLYLFPTKALAQDQWVELQAWTDALAAGIAPAIYDGDTPPSRRRRLREQARLVLSNPDMLHTGILPHHTQWADFFCGLRYVVLDEIHAYRGVFGSHVANVLRRLRRVARFYGSNPVFILTSATVANPQEHAERLVEAPVRPITANGAPSGERHFLFYNPPPLVTEPDLRRSNLLEALDLGERLLKAGVQTLFFARSRLRVELLLSYLREAYARWGGHPTAVRGYRGGYLPHERRQIEAGLRQGEVRAVVATNALELGIDIGSLEAAVIVGFPGTIAATWQQAGRAGRRQGSALAVLIAGADALDQYIVRHPEFFFGRSPEQVLIQPDNPVILVQHLRCAAFELPFPGGETFGNSPLTAELLAFLAAEGEVQQSGGRWFWVDSTYPARTVSLRAVGEPVIILQRAEADMPAVTIGQLEREAAVALVHEGAIYLHEGQTYLVEHLDWQAGQAYVRPVEVDYYTEALGVTTIRVLAVHHQVSEATLLHGYGDVEVRRRITGYRRIRRRTHEPLGYGDLDLPETVLETGGYWLSPASVLVAWLREQGLWSSDPNDYGPNWAAQRDLARARDGYRCTLCGAPERPGRQHDVHHIRPFRHFGYVPGVNTAYLEANRLENLRTLCRHCHQRLEQTQRLRSGLGGLAYLLAHLAPLYLMCDPTDLGYHVELQASHTDLPTLILFEQVAGGLGLAERLFELQPALLRAAAEVIANCPCAYGCPACVGPVGEGAEALAWDTKALTQALVRGLLEAG
jgi:DEAD/DEAH box helicase domain-containing protein